MFETCKTYRANEKFTQRFRLETVMKHPVSPDFYRLKVVGLI
jgi:hypothetical protein